MSGRLIRLGVGVGVAAAAFAVTLPATGATAPVVAPYLDVAGPNTGNLQAAVTSAHLGSFSAAFVIGEKSTNRTGCTPHWDNGQAVSSDTAATTLIDNATKAGASLIVSFGGQGGIDLAQSCASQSKLDAAYASVVRKFSPRGVDFDIEGKELTADVAERLAAIKSVETAFPKLVVSLTLPVGPGGLPKPEDSILKAAKTDGVRVDVVNIMAMDYGTSGTEMGTAAEGAAAHTLSQVQAVWPGDGYANIGITPMIGQNDTSGEIFTTTDAQNLASWAGGHGVGRLAFWSLNRDQQCQSGGTLDSCSGVSQSPLQFTKAFGG